MGISSLLSLLIALLAILVFSPFFFETRDRPLPSEIPFDGPLSVNEDLNKAEILFSNQEFENRILKGFESFASKGDFLYTGLIGGNIIKINVKTLEISKVLQLETCAKNTLELDCARPLGLKFDSLKEYLYVADSNLGLLRVDEKSKNIRVLVSSSTLINGVPNKITNSLVLAQNDTVIYYTVSSTKYDLSRGMIEILSEPSGRLLQHDLKTGKNTVLIKGLSFANGLLLTNDQKSLLIAESSAFRVLKYEIENGETSIFAYLPGVPDNLQSNGAGGIIIGIIAPFPPHTNSLFKILSTHNFLRVPTVGLLKVLNTGLSFLSSFPFAESLRYFLTNTETASRYSLPYGLLLEYNENGNIERSWHSSNGISSRYSEGYIHGDGYMYLGSPYNTFLARIPYP